MDSKTRKKRGAKAIEPSLIRYERINELMKRENLKPNKLAERMGREPSNVYRILKPQKISDDFINQIIIAFPDYRKEWLLGYDDFATETEKNAAALRRTKLDAPLIVLDDALKEVCARENIPTPELDNIPELLLIEAQLKDYAVSLMWNYVKWKHNSHVWSYLEQVEESAKRKEKNNG